MAEINGHTTSDDLHAGAIVRTDRDLSDLGESGILHISTGSGRGYDFFAAEVEDGSVLEFKPQPWSTIRVKMARLEARLYRLDLLPMHGGEDVIAVAVRPSDLP